MTDKAGELAGELALFAWASPSYPVGAFAYSHGVESAVERGDISDGATLQDWLLDILKSGTGRNDAILFVATWKACREAPGRLADIAELAVALATSRERRLETLQQGSGFLAATRAAWPCAALERHASRIGGNTAYCVVFAATVAAHNLPLRPAVDAYLAAFTSNLVSAAVRMSVIGQTEGQAIVARLAPAIRDMAQNVQDADIEDLGGFAFRADQAALHHETQYSRLFRS
ncbi:urease accessory protein UreF [Roseiarcaceae bacterium H3SJ34-1]|uniref:urease accessory protein UreF n=1 Tax=Terripilifer ovatus TaxID=3032367 RepID=UPI003AB95A8A|nr:urease accessory protein UreF [Roseiarcaceae bacterium H3SJ34-1]